MFKIIVFTLSLFFSVSVFAKSETLAKPSAMSQQTKSEVIEFFSFGCSHCNTFEPKLDVWKAKNSDILFKKVPIGFNPSWRPLQKLFYTLEVLKAPESKYKDVFKALHVEYKKLYSDDNIVQWAVENGFDKQIFLDAYMSFTVKSKVSAADVLAKQYDVQSVPSMVVNGKHIVYMDSTGPEGFFKEVDSLVKRK